ncbi:MAG TPA: IS21-like element helper ATPase IstB [Acidobacteriota bacterium]|nr:IS21-like element helper ATPase IstB [Acidobacteriota bacterium]
MESTIELKQYLKMLRLSPLLTTLPERAAYAKSHKLTHLEFLEMLLADEVERRNHGALARRMHLANVNHDQILERFDWEAKITLDRDRLNSLVGLEWIECKENVIFTGPVGVGKTFIANALAHVACRRNKSVIVVKAAQMFKTLYAARADNSLERELVRLIAPGLLVIDDFGLVKLSPEQSRDFYEIISERYGRASTIITSNRDIAEWVHLFDDSILANSALDRLAHNAHQMIIEGESYRKKKGTTRTMM